MSSVFSSEAEIFNNSAPNTTYPISFSHSIMDAYPFDSKSVEWNDLRVILENFSKFPYPKKEDAPLITPTIFHDGHRCNASATDTACAFLDTDGGNIGINEIVEWLREQRLEGIVYSSARNRPENPRWR